MFNQYVVVSSQKSQCLAWLLKMKKKEVISIQNDQKYNIEFHTADEGKTYARIDLDEGMMFTQYSKYAGERTIILLY